MSRNTLLGAACLLLVGLLVGYIAGSGGPSLSEIDRTVAARIDAANKADADRVAALEAKVTELGGRVDAIGEQVKSGADGIQGLGARLAELGSELGDSVSAAGKSSLDALQAGLGDLKKSLAATPAPAPAAPDAAAAKPAAAASAPAEATTEASTGAPIGTAPGETVVLSEAARIFVSRVDSAAGEAVVYVNGRPATLKVGQTEPFDANGEDCQLTVTALDRGRVSLDGACGDDLPAATGTSAGTVALLADGAVRVFVSAVDAAGARIAVNGVNVEEVAVGKSIDVTAGDKACKVTVTGVDRGHVALDAACS